jgi:carbon-monoxide dehydrogenase small subunit
MTLPVRIRVNGAWREHEVEPRLLLVHFLRDVCGLTGTHVGCETSICGACTVLVDGHAVKSCTMLAVQADGAEITTIEGLAPREESESSNAAARASGGGAPRATNIDGDLHGGLHPVQQGFWECHGAQCGFCTPGMILSAVQLLDRNPAPSRPEIAHALRGNLCRCTGYSHIIDAVEHASRLRAADASASLAGALAKAGAPRASTRS